MSKEIELKWFAIRCLFSHSERTRDGDGNLYEERITLWRAESWDTAYRLAAEEGKKYARQQKCVLLKYWDAFHLFDKEIEEGTEIWSVMRGSNLSEKSYADTFMVTPRDRCGGQW